MLIPIWHATQQRSRRTWGQRVLGPVVPVLVLALLLGGLDVHQSVLLRQLWTQSNTVIQGVGDTAECHKCRAVTGVGTGRGHSTGPVCSRKPVSMAPVRGLKEFPQTGGFSINERRELPSWEPRVSIMPGGEQRSHNPEVSNPSRVQLTSEHPVHLSRKHHLAAQAKSCSASP